MDPTEAVWTFQKKKSPASIGIGNPDLSVRSLVPIQTALPWVPVFAITITTGQQCSFVQSINYSYSIVVNVYPRVAYRACLCGRSIAARIFNLTTSFTYRLRYPQRKNSPWSLLEKIHEPQNRSERF